MAAKQADFMRMRDHLEKWSCGFMAGALKAAAGDLDNTYSHDPTPSRDELREEARNYVLGDEELREVPYHVMAEYIEKLIETQNERNHREDN